MSIVFLCHCILDDLSKTLPDLVRHFKHTIWWLSKSRLIQQHIRITLLIPVSIRHGINAQTVNLESNQVILIDRAFKLKTLCLLLVLTYDAIAVQGLNRTSHYRTEAASHFVGSWSVSVMVCHMLVSAWFFPQVALAQGKLEPAAINTRCL